MSRITDARFRASTANIQKGRVIVSYTNGREDEFDDIDRGQFFQWYERGCDVHRPPFGVRIASSAIEEAQPRDIEEHESEEIHAENCRLARRARIQQTNTEWYENQRQRKAKQEAERAAQIDEILNGD